MKAILRGIVSMAFSTIEDQSRQRRPSVAADVKSLTARRVVTPPPPVPADEVYKPLSSSDPVPYGAVTKVESIDTSDLDDSVFSTADEEELFSQVVKPEDLVPDNLAEIKGLNPIAIMGLNQRGIITFMQIANLTDQEITEIEEELDLPGCFNRFSWRYQARQLHIDNS
tara:strand:+ start:507 stop:1013 length:507 start_codon:yes stop_codon:yes gene_type:complete